MQTNEELAMLAKQNDRDAMTALWSQTEKLLHVMMRKYFPLCQGCGIEPDDLKQAAYFALVRAVNSYDPERGYMFTSYLSYHVSNTAREALGLRGHKTRPQYVRSLDEPLPGIDGEEIRLIDTIVDEEAEAAFERAQDEVQREQFRACLDSCMEDMRPVWASVLTDRFFEGKTLQVIAEERGCSRDNVRQLERKALAYLRHPRQARQLRPYVDYTHGHSLTTFRERGYVSQVEVLAGAW